MKSDQGWVMWSWGRCWKMASLSLHPHLSLEKAPGHHHDDHHGHGHHGHHGHHHHHGHGHHLHPPLSHISILIIACSAVAAWSGSEKSTLFIIPGISNQVHHTWIVKPSIPGLSYVVYLDYQTCSIPGLSNLDYHTWIIKPSIPRL